MPVVEVDDQTFQLLRVVARLAGTSEGAVVSNLLAEVMSEVGSSRGEQPVALAALADSVVPSDQAPAVRTVRADYMGHRFEATVQVHSGRTRIIAAPVELRSSDFQSPTAAAREVVETVNPGREYSNTNGRLFWIDVLTGRPIRDFMGRR